MNLTEPTAEQCSTNARLPDVDGSPAYACWYPQMGGYVGKAVVVITPPANAGDYDTCFEAYVWHDGEFPFDEGGPVRHLHHCMPSQFVDFGELVLKLQGAPVQQRTVTLSQEQCERLISLVRTIAIHEVHSFRTSGVGCVHDGKQCRESSVIAIKATDEIRQMLGLTEDRTDVQ